jgi:hypothetical protein
MTQIPRVLLRPDERGAQAVFMALTTQMMHGHARRGADISVVQHWPCTPTSTTTFAKPCGTKMPFFFSFL